MQSDVASLSVLLISTLFPDALAFKSGSHLSVELVCTTTHTPLHIMV